MEMLVAKLGGSLITDKSGEAALRPRRLARLAAEIAEVTDSSDVGLLLAHGSGSYGHVAAHRHGFGDPEGRRTAEGISAVQFAAAELHRHVTERLRRSGIPVFSFAPSSFMVAAAGRPRSLASAALQGALDQGLVPVTHGDVVIDSARGASICSTETVLLTICRRLQRRGVKLRAAYWFGDTDGVYDADGATMATIEASHIGRLLREIGDAGTVDVTGGMRHRLETTAAFARLGVESWILDGVRPGSVSAALSGEPLGGTHVVARARARG